MGDNFVGMNLQNCFLHGLFGRFGNQKFKAKLRIARLYALFSNIGIGSLQGSKRAGARRSKMAFVVGPRTTCSGAIRGLLHCFRMASGHIDHPAEQFPSTGHHDLGIADSQSFSERETHTALNAVPIGMAGVQSHSATNGEFHGALDGRSAGNLL